MCTKEKFVAYWLGYASTPPTMQSLPDGINVINLFLLNLYPSPNGTTLNNSYIQSGGLTWSEILTQAQAVRSKGVKVCASIMSTPNPSIDWNTIPDPDVFAQNVYDLIVLWNLDGIDIDPEQGGISPNQNFVTVVQELSKYFGPNAGTGLIMSYVGYEFNSDEIVLTPAGNLFDYVMTMGYFWSYDEMIKEFEQYATIIPSDQLLIGISPGPNAVTPLEETEQLTVWEPGTGNKGGMMEFNIGYDPNYEYANFIIQNIPCLPST